MLFDWDDAKAVKNLRKHKVSFEAAFNFEFDTAIIRSVDVEHGEERIVALGFIGQTLHVLVYAERGDVIRTISVRPRSRK
jgi:uncharacterized DUF497 family protein